VAATGQHASTSSFTGTSASREFKPPSGVGVNTGSSRCRAANRYSIFDSALYRNLEAEWPFPQEKATFHDVQMATSESKML